MADPTENLGRIGLTLGEALADTDDLDGVVRAVARERAIRDTMAETGETREIVTEVVEAAEAMSEEGVLDLTEGEPTTLRDALSRYVDSLENDAHSGNLHEVAADLTTLINYPWPQR